MSRLTSEEVQKVIGRLIGYTEPEGDTYIDETRLYNTKLLVDIAYSLIDELCEVARYRERYESSMKEIGQTAHNCLLEIDSLLKHELDRV
jgi:hypothetical protein